MTRTSENYANYKYDAIGQVTNDLAFETSGGAARLNEQLVYVFDPAGNLQYRTNNALIENFQVNTLNELTANTNGGTLTVMGTTTSHATNVTVNSTTASNYNDATFAAPGLSLATTYTATASDNLGRSASNTVTVSIATNTTFQYDGNGNLTYDGLRNFAYDDENQLIQVWVTNQYFSQFTYDGKMRRRIRQEYAWQGGAWVRTNEVYYVYDGNEVIQERDLNNLPTTTYTRGKDLSGSLEGAGGIGGLLARTSQAYADGPLAGQSYYHSDGNGNVTMLINSSNAIVAKYLYDAFGNILSKSGLLADANLYRFSSKETHPNSGLVYYVYRYYDPNLQRWPNRDPLGEPGFETGRYLHALGVGNPLLTCTEALLGANLYQPFDNNTVSRIDEYGLDPKGTMTACDVAKAIAAAANAAYKQAIGTPGQAQAQANWIAAVNAAIAACGGGPQNPVPLPPTKIPVPCPTYNPDGNSHNNVIIDNLNPQQIQKTCAWTLVGGTAGAGGYWVWVCIVAGSPVGL